MGEQQQLIDRLVAGGGNYWLLIADALRADVAAELVPELVTLPEGGEVGVVDNGGHGFTASWFAATFPGEYRALFANPQPLHTFQTGPGYDERLHFDLVPSASEFEWDGELATCPPEAVMAVVRDWLGEDVPAELERLQALGYVEDAAAAAAARTSGVVRFVQPHPPFRGLVELTKGRANRSSKLATAARAGEVDRETVVAAYRDTARWLLEGLDDFVDDLEGTVVLTADHGELLGEDGLWLHGDEYADRPELRQVPWVVLQE